ncbi:MAG: hypothetical protein ACTHJ8_10595 [Mucilaginibacter sp.]
MAKNHLTLADLKKQGFKLGKYEAQELHSKVNHIAQHGGDSDIVFDGEDEEEIADEPKKETAAQKKKRQKEQGVMDHTVSQEFLDNNPDLTENGVQVGDVIEIPVNDDNQSTSLITL